MSSHPNCFEDGETKSCSKLDISRYMQQQGFIKPIEVALRERARGLRCQRLHSELEEDISLTSIPQLRQSAPTRRHRISVLVNCNEKS